MLRAYLDNNVTSAITRGDLKAPELAALRKLLALRRLGKLILETSRQSVREMERAKPQYQAKLKEGLSEVGLAENDHKVLGSYTLADQYGGFICNPLVTDIIDEDLYRQLVNAGLESDDAKHLMYAVHNAFDRFVTCDKDFLNRRDDLEKRCGPIQIQKPSELAAELTSMDNRIHRAGRSSPTRGDAAADRKDRYPQR